MSVKTFYLSLTVPPGTNFLTLLDGAAPVTAITTSGWTVGTSTPTKYSSLQRATERAESTFGPGALPGDAGPDNTLGDSFRSDLLNGRFAAGNWTIAFAVLASTAGGAADGRVRVRFWKSANADGSAATELTSGAQTGTTVTNLTTGTHQISTVTWAAREFGLVDEYLFMSVAWEITGAGAGATDDVLWERGGASVVTSPDFVVATGTEYWGVLAGQGLIFNKGDYVRNLAQQFAAQVSSESAGVRLGESVMGMPGYAGGEGFPNFDAENPTRYYQGLGVDVTTTKDKAQVGPGLIASLSSVRNAQRVFGLYNSELYVGSSTGEVARQTATDTWTDPVGTITSNREVTGIAEAIQPVNNVTARMWVANRTNGQLASWNGATFTNNAADTNTGTKALSRVTYLGSWGESATTSFLIGGKLGAANQAVMGRPNSGAWGAGDWHGDADTSDAGYPDVTAAVVSSDGNLYWCASDTSGMKAQIIQSTRPSGIPFDGPKATIAYLSDDYLTVLLELNGVMYGLGATGRLYSIGTDQVTVVTTANSPSTATLYGMASWQNALWIACRSGTSLLVRRYGQSDPADPASPLIWSDPIYGGAIDASATAARQLIPFGGYLYAATEAAGASKIYRMDKAIFNTSPVTLQTGEIALSSAVIVKSIRVDHSALASGDSVTLKYARNGSTTFVTLGTNTTVGSTATVYPVAASGQVSRLSVQAVITAGSSAATPQLGQLTIVVRPVGDVTREWSITIEMFGTAGTPDHRKDGTAEPHTGQVVNNSLWAIFEEGVTQRFRDMDGLIYTVIVSDFSDHPKEELGHSAGLRWSGSLTLREV